jgi:hypothetical protein
MIRLGLALLCLASCAPQELRFSYVGSDDGFAQVTSAASAWRDACGSVVVIDRGGEGVPLEEVDAPSLGVEPGTAGTLAAGATTINGDDVRSMRFVKGERGREIIMHELGHALGIHYHADHGIMARAAQRTAEDVRVTANECGMLP